MRYEVRIQLPPSRGGHLRSFTVDAESRAEAIVLAGLKIEAQGEVRWELKGVAEVTS